MWRFVGLVIVSMLCAAEAGEARKFIVPIAEAQDIDLEKHHYSVGIVNGWIDRKDSFFRRLISDNKKLVIGIRTGVKLFDGDTIDVAAAKTNEDVSAILSRPWGLNTMLLDRVPGDASSRLSFRIALHKEDRIAQIFGAVEATNVDVVTDIFAKQWAGYAKFVGKLFERIFGTDKTQFPFVAELDVPHSDSASRGVMKEHYIVLISPNSDKDGPNIQNMDQSKLAYDAETGRLLYDEQPFEGRTHVILKVSRGRDYDINALLFQSKAPWAVLARNTLHAVPTDHAKNRDELVAIAADVRKQLQTTLALLLKELRFTKFERAMALHRFASNAIEAIEERCKDLNVLRLRYPTRDLKRFRKEIANRFGISKRNRSDLEPAALALRFSEPD